MHDHLRRKLAPYGLRGGHPFLDDLPLIERMLRLPPELARQGRLDRPVLRAAMQGLIPEEIRRSTAKSRFDRLLLDAILGTDRAWVESLLGSRDTELRAHVRDEALQRYARPPARPDLPWAWRAWRLASVELWLRQLRTS